VTRIALRVAELRVLASAPNAAGLPAGRWPVAAWVTYLSFEHNFSSGLGVKLQTERALGHTA
jgi:hypothetical protein